MPDTISPPRAAAVHPAEHHVFRSRRSGVPRLRTYFPELWARREFVYELARCTLRGQNYTNVFGQLWLVLNPLLMGLVYFVLADILSNGKHAANYFSMLLAGLFVYTFFASMLSQSAGSIIGSSRLILNSRLPRMVLPLDDRVIIRVTDTKDMSTYRDTNGDGVADEVKKIFEGGPQEGNLEHQPSGLLWDIDNWMYLTHTPERFRFTHGKIEREPYTLNVGTDPSTFDLIGRYYHASVTVKF